MKTLTIDIINEKAIKLLQELESLKLIRVRKEMTDSSSTINWNKLYKGLMKKQSRAEIDSQLNSLR
jgi:hypothetical protein